jgi:HEAT repeat protein
MVLAGIGGKQRFNSDAGLPTTKTLAATAIPRIQSALHDTNDSTRSLAAQALWFIGPPSAVAVPDLIKLAADPNEPSACQAVQSFGTIGPAASKAVKVLTDIAMSDRTDRLCAVEALGGIGPAAHASAPALASALNGTNEILRVKAARALAEIGVIPDEAVPALLEMQRTTNDWARTVASFALWSRNRNDPQLRAELVSALHSERRGWLLFSMKNLGTNVTPFLSEIKPLANDPDQNVRKNARVVMRTIHSDER